MRFVTIRHIHSFLWSHFDKGQGAAGYLRGKIPGFSQYLKSFFESRSDIDRLQQAEYLSERILSLTDFSDMITLRSTVATLEIKRLIAYKKQTDHTAHTLYLFLLGIWVYDHIPQIREAVDTSIDGSKQVKMFIFQWMFASLLHDVGYLFYDFEEGNNSSLWNIYDEMLSFDYMLRFSDNLSQTGKKELKDLWDDFTRQYTLSVHAKQKDSKELIEALDNIPWLSELIPGYQSGLLTMDLQSSIGSGLPQFAYQMATTGYDGKPVVDHGVASSLILLKYTSIWYWISKRSAEEKPQLYKELNSDFHYYSHVLEKHVVPACRAVAYHNMHGVKFNLQQDPLLFLAVLCDELQIWDRFLSGSQHIDNWQTIEHCMAENIEAELIYGEAGSPLLHLMVSETHYNKLNESLQKRVEQWDHYVQLTKIG
jgi:hypothetical protein